MAELTRRSVLAGLSAFAVSPALAQSGWPNRPVMLVHGFPPGGPVDTLSRILAEAMSRSLGQIVIVEAKPGATGTTAAAQVAHAKPDGYTLMAVPATYVATSAMYRSLPYRPIEDFSFISTTAEYPMVIVTHPDSPIKNLADMVAQAGTHSTPLQYCTAGVGSLQHLSMELIAKRANIKLQHIPYRGGAPAITDLLGKRLDIVIDPPTALMQLIAEDRLRALAVSGAARFAGLPTVPTVAESGFAGFAVTAYQGIAAPAGLPEELVQKLNKVLAGVLSDPVVGEQMRKVGNTPVPSSPAQYKERLIADIAQWSKLIADTSIARM
jgi:tripartite-type tricarboxylate transporter receptor subunit TctC